jgi:hypothetical protein
MTQRLRSCFLSVFEAFERPFLTIWAGNDAGGLGGCEIQDELICNVAGAADRKNSGRTYDLVQMLECPHH